MRRRQPDRSRSRHRCVPTRIISTFWCEYSRIAAVAPAPVGQVRAETHGSVGVGRVVAGNGAGGGGGGGGGHKRGNGGGGRGGVGECTGERKGAGD